MNLDLDESVAQAMEADVRLLPLLPELLADLWELGPPAEQVLAALESVGLEPGSTVLDLACGKGAVAVALAEAEQAEARHRHVRIGGKANQSTQQSCPTEPACSRYPLRAQRMPQGRTFEDR